MSEPRTYADWVRCLDAFKEGDRDEEALLLMERGTMEWTAGVAEKMTQRLYELLEFRMKRASEQMNTEFTRARDPNVDVVRALMNARKRFSLLKRLVTISAFPEQVRGTMTDILADYVKDTQASLEDSARGDRTGQLRLLIKNNSLLGYEQSDLSASPNNNTQGPNPKGRKVIF